MFELGARPHPARALYRAYLAQSYMFVGLYCFEAVAAYAAAGGNLTDAARLLGLARALRDVLGARIWAVLELNSRGIHDRVRSADEPWFDAAFADGRTLDPHTGAMRCREVLGVPVSHPDTIAAPRT